MLKQFLFGTALTVMVTSLIVMAPNSARMAFASDSFKVAEDSVFIDEGDGDFALPLAPTKDEAKEIKEAAASEKPAVKAPKKTTSKSAKAPSKKGHKPASEDAPDSLEDLEAAANAPVENEAPVELDAAPSLAESAPAPTATPVEEPSMAPIEEPKPVAAPTEEKAVEPTPEKPVDKSADKPADKPKKSKKAKAQKAEPKKSEKKAAKKNSKGKFATTAKACPMHREPASESDTMITVQAPKKIWVEEVDETWVRAFNKAGEPGYVNSECFE